MTTRIQAPHNATYSVASPKAIKLAQDMLRDRQVPAEWIPKALEAIEQAEALRVSRLIDALKELPWKPRTFLNVPAGRYAVDNEQGQLRFYVVDRPEEGKWKGHLFLSVQASDELHPVRGQAATEILRKIMADPKAAMVRYGLELGVCGRCGRTLTDEASRAAGIGPICASKPL